MREAQRAPFTRAHQRLTQSQLLGPSPPPPSPSCSETHTQTTRGEGTHTLRVRHTHTHPEWKVHTHTPLRVRCTHTHTLRVRYRHAPSALNIFMLTQKNNDVHSTTTGTTGLSEDQKAKSDLQLERKWCTETLPFNCLDILCLCCVRFPFKFNIHLYGKISGLNTRTPRKAANE